jgi:hypothetical protein
VKIQFKLRPDADDAECRRVVHEVARAERLFPEDDDPELATFYVADLPDDRAAAALDELQRSDAVEFAEPQAERRLRR